MQSNTRLKNYSSPGNGKNFHYIISYGHLSFPSLPLLKKKSSFAPFKTCPIKPNKQNTLSLKSQKNFYYGDMCPLADVFVSTQLYSDPIRLLRRSNTGRVVTLDFFALLAPSLWEVERERERSCSLNHSGGDNFLK